MSDNLYDLLAGGFPTDRNRPAFLVPDGARGWREISYRALEQGAAQAAGRLRDLGVRMGDRVGLQVEKSVEAVMIYLGVLKLGAAFLPLNAAYTAAEVAYFRADAEPTAFITDAQAFIAEAAAASPLNETAAIAPDDLAAVIYTSGTTGRSKGAMLSHRNLAANALAVRKAWAFSSSEVLLHALPIFHVHGLFVAMHCAFLSGAPMVWLSKYSDAEVMAALPLSTVMMGVPTYYSRLLANPAFDHAAAKHMRVFISGSAPLTPTVFADFEARTGKRILERYGMSEAVIITSNPLDGERVAGSVGFPLPGVDIRIAGGKPAGETGAIEIRGPSVFAGYWRMPEKTAEEFTSDGWFVTGDVGHIDPDGRLWISGRAKDLVISGGYNVYPKEVELVLDEMDGVAESAVVGAPHPDFGEAVVAVVMLEAGVGPLDETARAEWETKLKAAARARLAAYKSPKSIVFVDDLPRNAMGKVQKNVLRARCKNLFG